MTLSDRQLLSLLEPYMHADPTRGGAEQPTASLLDAQAVGRLQAYLELLLKWNARTNLTAIREPEAIVRRHFGESLFLAVSVRSRLDATARILDFGSGAGLPGIPVQIVYPELRVVLAESQGKKVAFLREAVRILKLKATVWPKRVEDMPRDELFDLVMMRAVDQWAVAVDAAQKRVVAGGTLALLAGCESPVSSHFPCTSKPLPESRKRFLYLCGA